MLIGLLLVLAACAGNRPEPPAEPPPGTVSGTSGGLATLVLGDRVLAFVPASGPELNVVELGGGPLALASLRVQSLSLGFRPDACAADPLALKVACIGYETSRVAVISVQTDPLDFEVTGFDPGNEVWAGFSGGDCLNCGVLTDPGDDRFIVASGDGYRLYDYRGNLLGEHLDPQFVTENFGYDYRENRILSPEYAGLAGADQELWVIDLDDATAYRWTRRMTEVAGVPSNFLADAAAINLQTGLLVIGHEWSPGLLFVDLKNAGFAPGGTFTASAVYHTLTGVYSPWNWLTTGLAVESAHHIAFLEEEFGNAIGAVRLPEAPGLPDTLEYTSAALGGLGHPGIPEACKLWENVGDPHGLALFVTPGGGRPTGLVVNRDRTCLAVVDLEAFLEAPKASGENRVDPSYDLVENGVVRYRTLP